MLKDETIAILKKYDLYAQKKLGQNFLVDEKSLQEIINAGEINHTDHIIEVGPGLGTLTKRLCKQAESVTAVEIDTHLIPLLKTELEHCTNLTLINQDALTFELPQKPYKLIANIPYYITSPLINHFLKDAGLHNHQTPTIIVLLVQKEVAEKICAHGKDMNILALNVQVFGKPSIVKKVDKHSFYPAPKVDSAVIKIIPYQKPKINCDFKTFFKITSSAFLHKRKMLRKSLSPILKQLGDIKPEELFAKAGIEGTMRPQELSIEQWETLTNLII